MDINEYVSSLLQRVNKAVVLDRAEVKVGDWKPEPNKCHDNVTIFCLSNPVYQPVRGWLYFDLPGLPYVKFLAHSAVLAPDGKIYDITPSYASNIYPFITSLLSDEEYADLVEIRGIGEINH